MVFIRIMGSVSCLAYLYAYQAGFRLSLRITARNTAQRGQYEYDNNSLYDGH